MPFSDAEANALLNARLTGATIALYTVAPTNVGGGTEVIGGAYVRQPLPFAPAANREASPTGDTIFPTATAVWGPIVAFGVFGGDGRFIGWTPVEIVKTVNIDDIYVVKASAFKVRIP